MSSISCWHVKLIYCVQYIKILKKCILVYCNE